MNLEEGKKLIVYVTNFVAGFVSIAAFLMLLYGGYKYVVSGVSGEEGEKIKKVFIGAIIGIVISLGAYAAVNTLVKVNPGPDTKQAQNEIQSQGNQAE
jgi:TRAP-type C4-dicarboxylate transport system permease small subunit